MLYKLETLKNQFPLMNFDFIQDVNLLLIINSLQGRFIGGVVRDALLGIKTYDIDIATPLLPIQVINIMIKLNFHPVATGIEYGTISIFLKPYKIEITTLRKDVKTFGRKAEVIFEGTWEEDALRRDFTFNALYLENNNQEYYIHDYHNGIEDLLNKKIKFIGNYQERIKEDYLRIMRFVRFYLRYGTNQLENYENETKFLSEFVPHMNLLSIERIIMEINNILKTDKWILGIKILNHLKINEIFFKQKLFIPYNNQNMYEYMHQLPIQHKFLIIFHKINLKIIEKLPFEKIIKQELKMYIQSDWSLEYLSKIFYKEKEFYIIPFLLAMWSFINMINEDTDKYILKLINIFIKNEQMINFQEEFNIYKNNYVYINKEGPLRGEEEIQMRITFLKNYL